ncbi:hypothetical protein RB200_23245 [Streptomyces sp. PmtG]
MESTSSTPPSAAVGSQMVTEALGASPRHLERLHTPHSPADVLARLVYTAARHLDYLHQQFADAAQRAASHLTRAATGKTTVNSLGVLQNSGAQIDILAARRADAVEHLETLIHAYRQVAAADHAAAHSARRPAVAPVPRTRPARHRCARHTAGSPDPHPKEPMPAPRADLASFADALAARLPCDWHSTYRQHDQHSGQFPLDDEVWDVGHVHWAVGVFALRHDAQLSGPDGQRLCVIDRPLHPDQFLVAPLEPDEGLKPHHFAGVEEPNGIKVSNDPLRAAVAVSRRVLPRYRSALAAVRHNGQVQPEPPLRPAPPEVDQVLTLTRYADGALGAPYTTVPDEARTTLYLHGFQYHPHQGAFLLPATYGPIGQALRFQSLAQQLAAQGIGVNLRHSPPPPAAAPAPNTRAALPGSTPVTHRR